MDAYGERPWHHDDRAYADFNGIAKELMPVGPKWPIFQRKAETYWGFGHAVIGPSKLVCWSRQSASTFKLKLASVQLDFEDVEATAKTSVVA
jgi:hypothetical protein